MAKMANARNKPKRIAETEEPLTEETDFNEDDYLAGRISIGLVSSNRRLILDQNSLAVESPKSVAVRSSRNETLRNFYRSSTSDKAQAEAVDNNNNSSIQDGRSRPTANIKANQHETVPFPERFPVKSDVGVRVHTKQRQNNEPLFINKSATDVKPARDERVHIKGAAPIKSYDKEKLDSNIKTSAQPHSDETANVTPEVKKDKVCFKDDSKQRVYTEPSQKKSFQLHGVGTLPVHTGDRLTIRRKTNGDEIVQVVKKECSDKVCTKLDITDMQTADIKADDPHTAYYRVKACAEASPSSCNSKQEGNELEKTTDTDKVYNYLFYIGKRIPSKSFSKLCRSVNKQGMPSPPPPPTSSSSSSSLS